MTEEKSRPDGKADNTSLQMIENDLPKEFPRSKNSSNSTEFEKEIVVKNSCFKSRMKASDFFKDSIRRTEKRDTESDIQTQSFDLDQVIHAQNINCEKVNSIENSTQSMSDPCGKDLKKLCPLDEKCTEGDENEDNPFYVNHNVTWALHKWQNLPLLVSESPQHKDSNWERVLETDLQDPRVRKKYGLEVPETEKATAMVKVLKFDDSFYIDKPWDTTKSANQSMDKHRTSKEMIMELNRGQTDLGQIVSLEEALTENPPKRVKLSCSADVNEDALNIVDELIEECLTDVTDGSILREYNETSLKIDGYDLDLVSGYR